MYTDSIWFNCQGCSAHGDIIIFAADAWKLSLPKTIEKFSELGLAAENAVHLAAGDYTRYLARKEAIENFWYDAKAQTWNHDDDVIACRIRDLGVRHEVEDCHGILGVAHYDQITKLCAALGRPKPPRLRDDGPSIVFPFHDLPGRMTGVLLLQYNAAYEAKQTFIPLSGSKRRRAEAGYYLLQATWRSKQSDMRSTQFVLEDALAATKMQCDAIASGHGWLPIMASYTGPEAESYGNSWQSFGAADRIFYGHSPTPELISRACNAKGYVSAIPSKRIGTLPRLASIRNNALTWQNALKTTLAGVNEMTAEAIAKRLTIPAAKLHMFLGKIEKNFSPGFKDRIMTTANAPIDALMKVQRRWFVVERESGWWNQCGRQISNFNVVIDEVLHADTDEKIYNGRVFIDGEVYPFNDSARRIVHTGLLSFASNVAAANKKLAVFDDVWDKKAHLIALQLHPPKLINVSTQYGWDDNTSTFRFVRYELSHAGEVRETHPWPNPPKNKDFPTPMPIAPLPLHNIATPAHENSLIWALASATIANLLAPALRKDCVAVALTADTFDIATRVAEALGCDVEKTTAFQKHVAGNFLEAKTNNIVWPVICSGAFNDEVFGQNVPRYFNRPLLLRVTKQTANVSLSYGWQSIQHATTAKDSDISPLRYVLPAYVQRTLQNRMTSFGRPGFLTFTVLQDLNNWLLETYGKTFNLAHARSLILHGADAHKTLMRSVNDAVLAGKICVLPQPRTSRQAGNYILKRADHWWLNRRAIDHYFHGGRSVNPNWTAIIDLLQQEGVYMGEEVIHNMSGIRVSLDWFNNFCAGTELPTQKEIG